MAQGPQPGLPVSVYFVLCRKVLVQRDWVGKKTKKNGTSGYSRAPNKKKRKAPRRTSAASKCVLLCCRMNRCFSRPAEDAIKRLTCWLRYQSARQSYVDTIIAVPGTTVLHQDRIGPSLAQPTSIRKIVLRICVAIFLGAVHASNWPKAMSAMVVPCLLACTATITGDPS